MTTEPLKFLEKAVSIIEAADNRAMACDGPVNHVRDEMSDAEWGDFYVAIVAARDALAAKPATDSGLWLIWSNEHRAWWRPQSAGYTTKLDDAGHYSFAAAKEICDSACYRFSPVSDVPPETMVSVQCEIRMTGAKEAHEQFKKRSKRQFVPHAPRK